MKKLSLLIISTISVAGCGGGNAPDSGNGGAATGGTVSLLGKVAVCPASSSAKAKVSLPYGEDQSYEVTTNADGSYVLEVDPSKVGSVNPVVLNIESDNCAPESIFVENLANAQGQKTIDTQTITLRNLAPEEFVIPPPWRPLTHLGNDIYSGPANSKLQVAASGLTTSQPVGVLTQELKDQFKTAHVEFSARGMQTESVQCATQYNNQIGLSATGSSVPSPIVKTVQPGASDANGGFTRFSIPIDLSDFPVGSTINFVASSGQCMSGGTDYDDFELSNVIVRFAK